MLFVNNSNTTPNASGEDQKPAADAQNACGDTPLAFCFSYLQGREPREDKQLLLTLPGVVWSLP